MNQVNFKIFNQGMGLASCNNALGYWHYPGDATRADHQTSTNMNFGNLVPEDMLLEMHQAFILLFIFIRNAWLQLVDGQVLS